MTPTPTTRRLSGLAAGAAVLLFAASSAGAAAPTRARGAGELRDLQATSAQPTDHGTAQVTAVVAGGQTTVTLKVQGLDHAAAGDVLGAHVHTGSCVAGNGAAAGPHYNAGGGISDETEVWLDFTIQPNGTGAATTTVPFTIGDGAAGAVVIHAVHTDHSTGLAGARWACLPVQF
jgi:Copper/zinc superoxide dismutase (SODC)